MNIVERLVSENAKLKGEYKGTIEGILLNDIPQHLREKLEDIFKELESSDFKLIKIENNRVSKQDFGDDWECVKIPEGEKEIKVDEKKYILKSYMADLTENYLKRLLLSGKIKIEKGYEPEFEFLTK